VSASDATPSAPPPWARRLADVLLAFTAVSLPLSMSGMQIGIGALFGLAVAMRGLGHAVVRRTPLDGTLAVFFGALALSTLVSLRPWEAVGWRTLWVVCAYFGVFWWLRDRRHARRLAATVVAAGAVAAAYGIMQHWTGSDWYRQLLGRPIMVHPRIAGAEGFATVGFFANYLTFAHAMVFPLGWAVGFALAGHVAAGVAAALLVGAIAFSTARGVWLALGVGALLTLVVARGGRAAALLGALAAAAALAVAVSPGLREQAAPIFTLEGANAGRVGIWRANLDVVHDHPVFGLGWGRYRTAALPYYRAHPEADRRSHAHSDVLQMAAEAGLVGLAAFGLLFAVVLRLGWDAIRGAPDRDTWATATGAWLALCTFLLGGLTQYNFGDNEVAIAMWVAMAVLMRCREA
jgi:O-antigen ligase